MINYKEPGIRVAIINKATQDIMAAGLIVLYKEFPELMISFDFKYFFVVKENPLYEIKINTDDIVKFNIDRYKDEVYPYRGIKERDYKGEFIFHENDITELDAEIAPLVYALNSVGYKTTGSCCGHNYAVAWVHVIFDSFLSLKSLLKILEKDEYKSKFILTTNPDIMSTSPKEIRLSLQTIRMGKEAYSDIIELSEYLEKRKDYFIRINTLQV